MRLKARRSRTFAVASSAVVIGVGSLAWAVSPDVTTVYEVQQGLSAAPSWGVAPSSCPQRQFASPFDLGERTAATSAISGSVCGPPKTIQVRQSDTQKITDAQAYKELIKQLPADQQDEATRQLARYQNHQCGVGTKKNPKTFADCLPAGPAHDALKALLDRYNNAQDPSFKNQIAQSVQSSLLQTAGNDARQTFGDIKDQMKAVLDAQMDELRTAFLRDPSHKGSDGFMEESFARLKKAIDDVTLDLDAGPSMCVQGQHNTLFVRGRPKSDGSNGPARIVVCPATLAADSTAELASSLATALAHAVDSCSLDRMKMGRDPAHPNDPGLPMSGLFEPLRVCLATRDAQASRHRDDINNVLPDLTPPAPNNSGQVSAYKDKIARVQSTFATQAPQAPHCPQPMTSGTATSPTNGRRRDRSNDLLASFFGKLALDRYKDIKCHVTANQTDDQARRQESQADKSSRSAANGPPGSGCNGRMKDGYGSVLTQAGFLPFKYSSENLSLGQAEQQPAAPTQSQPAPVPAQASQAAASQPAPAPPPASGPAPITDYSRATPDQLQAREDAIDKARDATAAACTATVNSDTYPFDNAEALCKSSGQSLVDISLWDANSRPPVQMNGYAFKIGCRSRYNCTEHQWYDPEATYEGMASPSPTPAPDYNKNTVAADIRYYTDKNEAGGRFSIAAHACFLNAPAATGNEVTAACGAKPGASTVNVPVSPERSQVQLLGETSGATLTFGCQFYCACDSPRRCEVFEYPPPPGSERGQSGRRAYVPTDDDLKGQKGIAKAGDADLAAIRQGGQPTTPGLSYLNTRSAATITPGGGSQQPTTPSPGTTWATCARGAMGANTAEIDPSNADVIKKCGQPQASTASSAVDWTSCARAVVGPSGGQPDPNDSTIKQVCGNVPPPPPPPSGPPDRGRDTGGGLQVGSGGGGGGSRQGEMFSNVSDWTECARGVVGPKEKIYSNDETVIANCGYKPGSYHPGEDTQPASGGRTAAVANGTGVAITDHYPPGKLTVDTDLAVYNDRYLTLYNQVAGLNGACAHQLSALNGGGGNYCKGQSRALGRTIDLDEVHTPDRSLSITFQCMCKDGLPFVSIKSQNPPVDRVIDRSNAGDRERGRVADWDLYRKTHAGEVEDVCRNQVDFHSAQPGQREADFQNFLSGMHLQCGSSTGSTTFVDPASRFTREGGLISGAPLPYQCQMTCNCGAVAAMQATFAQQPGTRVAQVLTPGKEPCQAQPVLGRNVSEDLRFHSQALAGAGAGDHPSHAATPDEFRSHQGAAQTACENSRGSWDFSQKPCNQPVKWSAFVSGSDSDMQFTCVSSCACAVDPKTKQTLTTCAPGPLPAGNATTVEVPVAPPQKVATPGGGTPATLPVARVQSGSQVAAAPLPGAAASQAAASQAAASQAAPPQLRVGAGDATSQPVAATSQPGATTSQPVAAISQPGATTSQPAPPVVATTSQPKAGSQADAAAPRAPAARGMTPLGPSRKVSQVATIDSSKLDQGTANQIRARCGSDVGATRGNLTPDSLATASKSCQPDASGTTAVTSAPVYGDWQSLGNSSYRYQCGMNCSCDAITGGNFASCTARLAANDPKAFKVTKKVSCSTRTVSASAGKAACAPGSLPHTNFPLTTRDGCEYTCSCGYGLSGESASSALCLPNQSPN